MPDDVAAADDAVVVSCYNSLLLLSLFRSFNYNYEPSMNERVSSEGIAYREDAIGQKNRFFLSLFLLLLSISSSPALPSLSSSLP